MFAKINQDNLRLLLPGKIARVVQLIAISKGISQKEAMLVFYASKEYQLLQRENTKYWHYSPEQIFYLYSKG